MRHHKYRDYCLCDSCRKLFQREVEAALKRGEKKKKPKGRK